MPRRDPRDKRLKAQQLWFEDAYTPKEIAEKIGATEREVKLWAEQGEWDNYLGVLDNMISRSLQLHIHSQVVKRIKAGDAGEPDQLERILDAAIARFAKKQLGTGTGEISAADLSALTRAISGAKRTRKPKPPPEG